MKIAIAVLVLAGACLAQTFTWGGPATGHRGTLVSAVKQTPAEIAKLKTAREQMEKARAALILVEDEVKRAHGDNQCPTWALCTGGVDAVLEGDFVLIYQWTNPLRGNLTW